jgi:hypothetical protein
VPRQAEAGASWEGAEHTGDDVDRRVEAGWSAAENAQRPAAPMARRLSASGYPGRRYSIRAPDDLAWLPVRRRATPPDRARELNPAAD